MREKVKANSTSQSLPVFLLCLLLAGCSTPEKPAGEVVVEPPMVQESEALTRETQEAEQPETQASDSDTPPLVLSDIPEYDGEPYVVIHDNIPDFSERDLTMDSFEKYNALDALGRCGVAFANVGADLMPTEERGEIGQVRPSGWQLAKYDNVDGKFLYNRCHLIAYQLAGENANERNLITGTRYLNIVGMLPFENRVADYVKETGNHVLYRVTPLYDGDNLVASGVEMEGLSVEDGGEGISFHVFCYNVQPGIRIDYANGDSHQEKNGAVSQEEHIYILNTNTHKFHDVDCDSVSQMADHNKKEYTGSREDVIEMGYEPCRNCNP